MDEREVGVLIPAERFVRVGIREWDVERRLKCALDSADGIEQSLSCTVLATQSSHTRCFTARHCTAKVRRDGAVIGWWTSFVDGIEVSVGCFPAQLGVWRG